MGWTYTDLGRNRQSLEQAKAQHVWEATRYGSTVKAELLAHEWKPKSFFAIVRLTYLEGHVKAGTSTTFLQTDMIDTAGGQFGYKGMDESVGPYLDDKPSPAFRKMVFDLIPCAEGYAQEFRKRAGIKFLSAQPPRDLWNNPQGPSAPDLNQTKMEF